MYPRWWNEKITLYNKYNGLDENGRTIIKWQKTILSNCFFQQVSKKELIGNSVVTQNINIVRIPFNKSFLPFADFIDSTKETYFTLNPGDIVVKGIILDEIEDAHSGNVLFEKYPNLLIMEVKKVSINDALQNKHYMGMD